MQYTNRPGHFARSLLFFFFPTIKYLFFPCLNNMKKIFQYDKNNQNYTYQYCSLKIVDVFHVTENIYSIHEVEFEYLLTREHEKAGNTGRCQRW